MIFQMNTEISPKVRQLLTYYKAKTPNDVLRHGHGARGGCGHGHWPVDKDKARGVGVEVGVPQSLTVMNASNLSVDRDVGKFHPSSAPQPTMYSLCTYACLSVPICLSIVCLSAEVVLKQQQ